MREQPVRAAGKALALGKMIVGVQTTLGPPAKRDDLCSSFGFAISGCPRQVAPKSVHRRCHHADGTQKDVDTFLKAVLRAQWKTWYLDLACIMNVNN